MSSIARYTTNASGVVPTFNEDYQYIVNETESNGIYTVELYSDTDFNRSCLPIYKIRLFRCKFKLVSVFLCNIFNEQLLISKGG